MEKNYIDGLFCRKPSEKAPQFIKAKVSIKKDQFINWLHTQDTEWVNIDILESQKGEFYGKVDEWKPNTDNAQKNAPQGNFDDVKAIREAHNAKSGFDNINNDDSVIDESQIPF